MAQAIKVNIKGLRRLEAEVKSKLENATRNTKMLRQIGEVAVERMKLKARTKKPLQGRVEGRFPVGYPTEATQRYRKWVAKNNATHAAYGKSGRLPNLTITGQLINGINFKVLKNKGIVQYFVGGVHIGYKTNKGKRTKNIPNETIYKDLLKQNQKFTILGIDQTLLKRINVLARKTLRKLLKA